MSLINPTQDNYIDILEKKGGNLRTISEVSSAKKDRTSDLSSGRRSALEKSLAKEKSIKVVNRIGNVFMNQASPLKANQDDCYGERDDLSDGEEDEKEMSSHSPLKGISRLNKVENDG